jgi:hypothetical protein
VVQYFQLLLGYQEGQALQVLLGYQGSLPHRPVPVLQKFPVALRYQGYQALQIFLEVLTLLQALDRQPAKALIKSKAAQQVL